jgi:hypothetical protein
VPTETASKVKKSSSVTHILTKLPSIGEVEEGAPTLDSAARRSRMPPKAKDAVDPQDMGELPLKLLGLRKKAKHSTTVGLPPIMP